MTQPKNLPIRLALAWPRLVTWLMVVSTAALVALAALPSLWPAAFPALNPLVIDTDPENMLADDEPVRVFHNRMKAEVAVPRDLFQEILRLIGGWWPRPPARC